MLLDGASDDAVMKELGLSKPTGRRCRSLLEAGGLEALRDLGVGGRESVLGPDRLAWITSALQDSGKVYGFESEVWTNSRVRMLIERKFGVRFTRVYIWQLATNLGLGHALSKSRR
jgi:transposase